MSSEPSHFSLLFGMSLLALPVRDGGFLTGKQKAIFDVSLSVFNTFVLCLQCLLHRALHLQERLPPIQQHILNMLDPPTEMKAKCESPLSKVKTLFPLTEVIKKKNQVTAQDVFQDK
jgi:hypothetical protein